MDDASLIAAFQLADSFFPSGMVTLSHGLETFLSIQPSAHVNIAHLLDDYLRGKSRRAISLPTCTPTEPPRRATYLACKKSISCLLPHSYRKNCGRVQP